MEQDGLEDMGPIDYLVVEFPRGVASQGVLSEEEFFAHKQRILGS